MILLLELWLANDSSSLSKLKRRRHNHPKTFADFAAASSSACFGSFIP
jgi:hypothetical protein